MIVKTQYLKTPLLFSLLLIACETASAQDSIRLENPSFEAYHAQVAALPSGWLDMSSGQETPPDIQPGFFGVELPAQDGKTYVGLVVRENNTWEGVGQRLSGFLEKDSSYSFSIYLTRCEEFSSAVKRDPRKQLNFDAPVVLKIYGFNKKAKQEELLAQSAPVTHAGWMKYTFTLRPALARYNELDLTAYYAPGFEQLNGNLLLDNCSAIVKMAK